MDVPSSSLWRERARVGVRLLLLAAVVAICLHFADVPAIGHAMAQTSVAILLMALAFDSGFYVVESWRLRQLSRGLYRFGALWRSRMVAALLANVLPGMISGEVLRIFLVDRYRPGNKLYVGLLLLANRLYGLLALGSLFLIAFAVDRHHVPSFVAAHRVLLSIACTAVLPTPLLLRIRPVRIAMVALIRRLRGRIRRVAYTVFNATAHFCDPKRWAIALVSSTLSNALVVLQFWIVGRSVGANLTLTEWAICVPVAAIASFLPIGFGSIGPQDATFVIVGRMTGHPIERLLALSVLMHLIQVTATLPGIIFLSDARQVVRDAIAVARSAAWRVRAAR